MLLGWNVELSVKRIIKCKRISHQSSDWILLDLLILA